MADNPPATPAAPDDGDTLSVVVVDDDGFAREYLAEALREDGYEVRSFDDPVAALESMREQAPSVLLSDWQMEPFDGPEFIRRVRGTPSLAGIYCILITAFDDEKRKIAGLESGADDFLGKGTSRDEILARIRVARRVRHLENASALLTMAATLGHEINNPLTGVLGYLELGMRYVRSEDSRKALECMERVHEAAERIKDVVARLVSISETRFKQYQPGSTMLDLDD